MSRDAHTGGCQCGAVRYRIAGGVEHTSVCHCRMCQKATGGLFGAFATAPTGSITWTRGAPAYFQSSTLAKRGFCPACGTPLSFVWNDETTSFTFGSFDDPAVLEVDFALAPECAHPALDTLPAVRSRPIAKLDAEKTAYAGMENFQHPDHDTDHWPEREEP
ncbi:GFA family protein [Pelagibacterium lacus]|uniref:GFA family protein n=1 Tax=Pelagibacterium lacus TaxID=2282655 RepID=A0A369W197_9HYPH|nr:GFA family protein [Pelagibacterium lacus]RDE08308.1 GFA family protein [Pelagibacterium lacus]